MPSPIEPKPSAELSPQLFAFCLLLASSLQIMENLLPKIPIFPWLRLGLAYLILLPFLLRFGAFKTLMLFICRNLITLVYGGQIFSAFLISTLSGIFSIGIVGNIVFYLYHKKVLGLIGTSVMLALTFNLMQLLIVNFMFIRHGDFFFQVSPLLLWSLLSGSLIALLVKKSISDLNLLFEGKNSTSLYYQELKKEKFSFYQWLSLLTGCGVFASLFLITSIQIQLIILPVILLITRFKNIKIIYYAWPFYFYLAWLHLFRTDGIYIYKDWITREGLDRFIFFTIRTTNIIICGQWLSRYISGVWRKSAGNFYIKSVGYALPLLPALFGLSVAMGREFFHQLRSRNFDNSVHAAINRLEAEFGKIAAPTGRSI
jgi:uncharacterized membrane protein